LATIVYDGPPTELTADVLTKIYGEEDWSATMRKVDDDGQGAAEQRTTRSARNRQPHRDRMAGLT
jgi:phosphonate transport system ATP-binding protein